PGDSGRHAAGGHHPPARQRDARSTLASKGGPPDRDPRRSPPEADRQAGGAAARAGGCRTKKREPPSEVVSGKVERLFCLIPRGPWFLEFILRRESCGRKCPTRAGRRSAGDPFWRIERVACRRAERHPRSARLLPRRTVAGGA